MDSCGRVAPVTKFCTYELSRQHHLCALWKDEVIKKAVTAGRLVESEFLRCSELNPFPGRSGRSVGYVAEDNFDKLERRASFKEGC